MSAPAKAPPGILIQLPVLAHFEPAIAHLGPVTRLWEIADPLAFARTEAGQAIQAVVTVGASPMDPALSEALTGIRMIVCAGIGVDKVDFARCAQRGIQVCNTPATNSDDVADMGVTLLLALTRRIIAGDDMVRTGKWRKHEYGELQRSIRDFKIGVVGLGAIGQAAAKRLSAFDCEVSWWGPRPKSVAYPRAATLEALADSSDVLFVAAPGDPGNRHMINADILSRLGPGGILVNVGRGSLVDETALRAALVGGTLGGAALDVFETEPTPPDLWKDVPNTIFTPHSGALTQRSINNIHRAIADNIEGFLREGRVRYPVINAGR